MGRRLVRRGHQLPGHLGYHPRRRRRGVPRSGRRRPGRADGVGSHQGVARGLGAGAVRDGRSTQGAAPGGHGRARPAGRGGGRPPGGRLRRRRASRHPVSSSSSRTPRRTHAPSPRPGRHSRPSRRLAKRSSSGLPRNWLGRGCATGFRSGRPSPWWATSHASRGRAGPDRHQGRPPARCDHPRGTTRRPPEPLSKAFNGGYPPSSACNRFRGQTSCSRVRRRRVFARLRRQSSPRQASKEPIT